MSIDGYYTLNQAIVYLKEQHGRDITLAGLRWHIYHSKKLRSKREGHQHFVSRRILDHFARTVEHRGPKAKS